MMADCMAVHEDYEQEWFRGIYNDAYQPLLAYARRRVDAAIADEVVADTFLTAWRRRADIPDGAERLWLFGVARNMIRNAKPVKMSPSSVGLRRVGCAKGTGHGDSRHMRGRL